MGRIIAAAIGFMILAFAALPAKAAYDRGALLRGLCGDASAIQVAGGELMSVAANGVSSDLEWSRQVVTALMNRKLNCADASVSIGGEPNLLDAATLQPLNAAPEGRSPVLSLKNRAQFEALAAAFTLLADPSAEARAGALKTFERRPESLPLAVLERAAREEKVGNLRDRLAGLAQMGALKSPDPDQRLAAIRKVAENPSTRTLTLLAGLKSDPLYQTDPGFKAGVDAGVAGVERWIVVSNALSAFYNGLSLASILFMAAVGLAVIFGLMGVINLAQGEFIMLGAYVTFLVQQAFKFALPAYVDFYLIAAAPIVFLVTSLIGVALEMALIRHFYTRPLMSLLATWAVSLFLVNSVRLLFGTQNLQFVTPFYVAGGIQVIGDFIITWNRLFAIGFAALTLIGAWFVLRRTPLGLNIRAVTLNRNMAGCIGINTRQIDRIAFGMGSGLAGLAGLALCPIYNVNPQMGTLFIIDSFMVVVLGGVGTLLGTVVASIGVGQINVLIEPLYGAVAAKVIVLLMIIGFLQWRPEGLFAIKGRRK